MQQRWDYWFTAAESDNAVDPAVVRPGGFPYLWGVDGRTDGVARRYPGHIRFPDVNGVLATSDTALSIVRAIRPFRVQQDTGSPHTLSGWIAGGGGRMEIWYRKSDDAAGVLRLKSLVNGFQSLSIAKYDPSVGNPSSGYIFMPTGGCMGGDLNYAIVYASAVFGGKLYVGGLFRGIGGRCAYGVMSWDGRAWKRVGVGFAHAVRVLVVHNNELWAGGQFSELADGTRCVRLAVLRNGRWIEQGNGITGDIYAMASFGTNTLYVGGSLTNVDTRGANTLVNFVARLNTSTGVWNTVGGTSCDGNVNALRVWNDGGGNDLYVGGAFTTLPDGTAANYIARWDGAAWTTLTTGSPPTGAVHALANISTTHLYAGGAGAGIGEVAEWTGGTWANNWATDAGKIVYALAVHNSVLYAGGDFTNINAVSVTNRFAKLASGTWTDIPDALGSLTGTIRRLDAHDDGATTGTSIWIGGAFTRNTDQISEYVFGRDGLVSPSIGCPWDITVRGPYIYLMTAAGLHKVIYWTGSDWTMQDFGPEMLTMPRPDSSVAATSGGRLVIGKYLGAIRYRDLRRFRWTGLSALSADVSFAANAGVYRLANTTQREIRRAPLSYQTDEGRVEVYSTISSSDVNVAAGGTLYKTLVTRIPGGSSDGAVDVLIGEGDTPPAGLESLPYSNLGDLSMVALAAMFPDNIYSAFDDEVGDIGPVCACVHHDDVTWAAEYDEGFIALRWSPTRRLEPENFPAENWYRTRISVQRASTVRLVAAGPFVYLFGDGRVYRAQRAGRTVAVIEVATNVPVLHRDAVQAVGMMIYFATRNGIYVMDGSTGDYRTVGKTGHIFTTRWRSSLGEGTWHTGIRLGYDQQLGALFAVNLLLNEALIIWSTGKTTLLPDMAFNAYASTEGDDGLTRLFMFSSNDYICYPNAVYDSTKSATMTGFTPYTGAYQARILSVAGGGNNILTFTGGAPHIFTSDGTTAIDVSRMYVWFLTGVHRGKRFSVSSNAAGTLTLDGTLSPAPAVGASTGDIVAFSPVPMLLVGSMPWLRSGTDQFTRRIVRGQQLAVSRVAAGAGAGITPISTDYGLFVAGVATYADLTAGEPLAAAPEQLIPLAERNADGPVDVRPSAAGLNPLGVGFNEERPYLNVVNVSGSGTKIFPFVLLMTSNLNLDISGWRVLGSVEAVATDAR